VFELVFFMWSGKKFIKNKQKIFECFKKKTEKDGKFFLNIKKIEERKKQKKKIIFMKFAPKRSAPKWATLKKATTKQATPKRYASDLEVRGTESKLETCRVSCIDLSYI